MKHLRSSRKSAFFSGPSFWMGSVILVLLVAGGAGELTGVTHIFHKKPPALSTSGNVDTGGGAAQDIQKGEPQTKASPSPNSNTSSSQPGDTKSETGGSTNFSLLNPSGDFVSAHHVSLSTPITSVCNTTPGAQCQINFATNNGMRESLSLETTDRGGSAYWNSWTPASIGMTTGTWQITATSTLDGQVKSTTDSMSLVVSP